MCDDALSAYVAAPIRHHLLNLKKTLDMHAEEAAISRSTLSLLENGESVNLATLIQVLRVLAKQHIKDAFEVDNTVSSLFFTRKKSENETEDLMHRSN